MTFTWALAARNIGRSPWRAALAGAAIAMGTAGIVFLWAFKNGIIDGVSANMIDYVAGHAQIVPAGHEGFSSTGFLRDPEAWIRRMDSQPGIRYARRLETEGLVATSQRSQGVAVIGVDAAEAPRALKLAASMREGLFLSGAKREILIGKKLAEEMRVGVGGRLVVTAQSAGGELAGAAFIVRGIFSVGVTQMDAGTVYISIADAREIAGSPEGVSSFVLRIDGSDGTAAAAVAGLRAASQPGGDAVKTWREIYPENEEWRLWYASVFRMIMLVVCAVVAIGILNTFLMSAFERTKEFGILLALGATPGRLAWLFAAEATLLLAAGIASGGAIGLGLVRFFGATGITFDRMREAFESQFMASVVHPSIGPAGFAVSLFAMAAITFLSVLYPIWRILHLEPVKAIYRP